LLWLIVRSREDVEEAVADIPKLAAWCRFQ
jgi:hypothetical protein